MEKRPILTLDSFKKQKTNQSSNSELEVQEQKSSTEEQNTQGITSNQTKEVKTAVTEAITPAQIPWGTFVLLWIKQ